MALRSLPRQFSRPKHPDGLFPFIMPWDDASPGPTNLSAWNRPIEGEADRLRLCSDGHLYRAGERIRLFGFNLSNGAAFPDPAVGARVAARLARQGANYVRIAQHSNLAPAGWFDPATAAALDREALERLDGFVAQLRRHGIYIDLVLNHFRRVYPSQIPGFEARERPPEGWPPYGTGVTQFYTPLIVQNQEAARQLLTHRNPWTGLRYADDPAIAIVEVTNEDGLVHTWREGFLDSIIAAGAPHLRPLRDELQVRWNRWLQERYPDDAAVHVAWAHGASRGGGELLTNGSFRQGAQGWRFETRAGARAQCRPANGDNAAGGLSVLEVQLERIDSEGWHVTVAQDHLRVEQERPYRVSLWARATRPGAKVSINLRQARPPYRILASRSIELTLIDQWTRHIARIAVSETEPDAALYIMVGREAGTIWIADVSLRADPSSGLLADESPARGTVAPLSRAGLSLRTLPAQRDWIAFLFEAESQFFAENFRFLRNELRVRSLIIGTRDDWSPAGAQAGSDVSSIHGYWANPIFPHGRWDPNDWFVRNRSMVGVRDEWHTLNRFAFYRRAAKPMIVIEYNHPQPNSFGAEGFPLAAAYGAFQDWDGIAGWTYREGSGSRWLSREDWARPVIRGYFALDTDPVRMLSAWLAAVIFRRGDVTPGTQRVSLAVNSEQEREIARTVGLAQRCEVIAWGAEVLPLRHRVAIEAGAPGETPGPEQAGTLIASDTGELAWEMNPAGGVVTVNTLRTKAVIGVGGGREFTLGAAAIRPGPTAQRGFGVWAITALDGGAPLHSARRLIIVALGYSQNTDQDWKVYPDHRVKAGPPGEGTALTLGSAWGRAPTLAEGVQACIVLPARHDRARVWALNEKGRRKKELPVRAERGLAVVELDARYRTLWYEVAVSTGTR